MNTLTKIIHVQRVSNSYKIYKNSLNDTEIRKRIFFIILYETPASMSDNVVPAMKTQFITASRLVQGYPELLSHFGCPLCVENDLEKLADGSITWLSEIIIEGESFPRWSQKGAEATLSKNVNKPSRARAK